MKPFLLNSVSSAMFENLLIAEFIAPIVKTSDSRCDLAL